MEDEEKNTTTANTTPPNGTSSQDMETNFQDMEANTSTAELKDIRWAFSQVKGTLDDDVADGMGFCYD